MITSLLKSSLYDFMNKRYGALNSHMQLMLIFLVYSKGVKKSRISLGLSFNFLSISLIITSSTFANTFPFSLYCLIKPFRFLILTSVWMHKIIS